MLGSLAFTGILRILGTDRLVRESLRRVYTGFITRIY